MHKHTYIVMQFCYSNIMTVHDVTVIIDIHVCTISKVTGINEEREVCLPNRK